MPKPFQDDRQSPSDDWDRPPEPPLHWAARHGDIALMGQLLSEGADIDERADLEHDDDSRLCGLTTLMVAARSIDGASVETLRWMVDHGADICARSSDGTTAAWYAAGLGGGWWWFHDSDGTPDHAQRLRYLLDLGLDPNECNSIGESLLTEACDAGDPDRVEILLLRGAKIQSRRGSVSGMPQHIQELLDQTSELWEGSASDGHKGECDTSQIPLFCAARSGDVRCVELLLDAGSNVKERDLGAETVLMQASSAGVARILLEHGVDVHSTDEFGYDALDHVLQGVGDACCGSSCDTDGFDVARVLIASGADTERIGQYGFSRLASLAFVHNAQGVETLLTLGASPHPTSHQERNAIHSVCWLGDTNDPKRRANCVRIIDSLIAAGVDPAQTDVGGGVALHEAAWGDRGNPTAIRALLRYKVQVDPRNHKGNTPLLLAAWRGEHECIKTLLNAGADPQVRNAQGDDALALANEHLDIWKSIVERDRKRLDDDRAEKMPSDADEDFDCASGGCLQRTPSKDEARKHHLEYLETAHEIVDLLTARIEDLQ